MAQRFRADFGSSFWRKKFLAAAFFAELTRALAPSCGHVLRRRKHPGADPASHAGRTARTALSHRDAYRVEPAWNGEGSVRPLAVANDVGPVEDIRRTQPEATLAAKLGRRLPAVRIPQRRNPWAIKRGKAAAAPGELITGVLAGWWPLQWGLAGLGTAGRARARGDLRTYHYFGYDRPVGTNLAYLVHDETGRDLAVHLIGAAARQCAARDRVIGGTRRRGPTVCAGLPITVVF